MKRYCNVAIVGCGYIAQTHLKVLRALKGFEVLAVCDSDEKKAMRTSKKWNVERSYTDLSNMLENEDISILSILTPPSSHAPLAVQALEHKVNVLIEKPLTTSTKEADLIMSALRNGDAKMTVVYHWLFSKAMLQSVALIKKEEIGEVLNVDLRALHAWQEDPMTRDPNHWSHRLLGGRFGEMLPHPVYILQSILGNNLQVERVRVSKSGRIPWMPNTELHVVLRSGEKVGSFYVSFNAPRAAIDVDVYGINGILKIDLISQTVLRLGPRAVDKFSIARDQISRSLTLLFLTVKNALQYSFSGHGQHSISNVYSMFRDSTRKGVDPPVTPEMAYNTVRIVEEICREIMNQKHA